MRGLFPCTIAGLPATAEIQKGEPVSRRRYICKRNNTIRLNAMAMEFKDLDPILHSQLRLAVVSLLISEKEAEFTFIREKTNATAGNLSVQINKLKEAGYIEVTKQFKDNYPQTMCKITPAGVAAFEQYVKDLQSYLGVNK
jgi:DNA-binding MarR family transcriptional regulator